MVWGTDINVNDVVNQFTQFVRGFREQTGTDAEGVPILEDEPKYMAYLQEVRACSPGALCGCAGFRTEKVLPAAGRTRHEQAVWAHAEEAQHMPVRRAGSRDCNAALA